WITADASLNVEAGGNVVVTGTTFTSGGLTGVSQALLEGGTAVTLQAKGGDLTLSSSALVTGDTMDLSASRNVSLSAQIGAVKAVGQTTPFATSTITVNAGSHISLQKDAGSSL